jgi:hypothetical protein
VHTSAVDKRPEKFAAARLLNIALLPSLAWAGEHGSLFLQDAFALIAALAE